jgi:signal transduction histidine kinase
VRRQLAFQLHDGTAQWLAALAISLDVVHKRAAALDGSARRALSESRALARRCFADAHLFANLLYPTLLDSLGLLQALRTHVARFAERTDIAVVFESDDGAWHRAREVDLLIFRLVETYLASATGPVTIALADRGGLIRLGIRQEARPGRGTGRRRDAMLLLHDSLQMLRARVVKSGGHMRIVGTALTVRLPAK